MAIGIKFVKSDELYKIEIITQKEPILTNQSINSSHLVIRAIRCNFISFSCQCILSHQQISFKKTIKCEK